jgi:hypothetical protein
METNIQEKVFDYSCPGYILGMIGSGIVSLFIIAGTITNFPRQNIKNCIQIKAAPRVFLIERAAEIIQKR